MLFFFGLDQLNYNSICPSIYGISTFETLCFTVLSCWKSTNSGFLGPLFIDFSSIGSPGLPKTEIILGLVKSTVITKVHLVRATIQQPTWHWMHMLVTGRSVSGGVWWNRGGSTNARYNQIAYDYIG